MRLLATQRGTSLGAGGRRFKSSRPDQLQARRPPCTHPTELLRHADATKKGLEARIRAEVVDPRVRFDLPRDVPAPLLSSFFQEFERPVLVVEAGVYGRDQVRRDIAFAGASLHVSEHRLRLRPP